MKIYLDYCWVDRWLGNLQWASIFLFQYSDNFTIEDSFTLSRGIQSYAINVTETLDNQWAHNPTWLNRISIYHMYLCTL